MMTTSSKIDSHHFQFEVFIVHLIIPFAVKVLNIQNDARGNLEKSLQTKVPTSIYSGNLDADALQFQRLHHYQQGPKT